MQLKPPEGSLPPKTNSDFAQVVARNIEALLERRREEEQQKSREDRIADNITAFAGSMWFVYLHVLVFGSWTLINLGGTPLPRFDPSFVILATVASVEAIFISTFVLISQNRASVQADKRADLDLQISLLAEHEITRLITLTSAIAKQMNLPESQNPELVELAQDVAPVKVLEQIEQHEQKYQSG